MISMFPIPIDLAKKSLMSLIILFILALVVLHLISGAGGVFKS